MNSKLEVIYQGKILLINGFEKNDIKKWITKHIIKFQTS